MEKKLRIIFMGTPEFAVAILDKIQSEFEISAVVTAPDKPAGRGQQTQQSAVKKYALEKGFEILQPEKLKDEKFLSDLKKINADLFVVVAFRMLPEAVWDMPPLGTINLHASLLPNYRGAAPINRAVMNGESKTGVTTFFIEKEIDTGKIIERAEIGIDKNETAGELHDKLMQLGAETTLSTVRKIAKGDVEALDQLKFIESELIAAPKIFKGDCQINFKNPAKEVHNFIRGLSPFPAAWCTLKNKNSGEVKSFKLFDSEISGLPNNCDQIKKAHSGFLFPCKDEFVLVKSIQMEGKRRMNFKEFSAGNNIEEWKIN